MKKTTTITVQPYEHGGWYASHDMDLKQARWITGHASPISAGEVVASLARALDLKDGEYRVKVRYEPAAD